MTWHLMFTPRNHHKAVRELLQQSRDDLDALVTRPLTTSRRMEVTIAEVIGRLVDVERYLHDPSMDWRRSR